MINGITTFCSSYFTGLNQGTASLVIALMKGFIGPLLAVFILPLIIGNDGIWFSPSAAEILTIIVCIVCFLWWRTKSIYDIEITDEE